MVFQIHDLQYVYFKYKEFFIYTSITDMVVICDNNLLRII